VKIWEDFTEEDSRKSLEFGHILTMMVLEYIFVLVCHITINVSELEEGRTIK